jgi:hypothetical protein
MEQIDGSETSAFKNQMPGIHPKDYSQYSKHGDNLKSRMFVYISVTCRIYEELWNKSLTLLMRAGIQNVVPKISPSSRIFTYQKYYGI